MVRKLGQNCSLARAVTASVIDPLIVNSSLIPAVPSDDRFLGRVRQERPPKYPRKKVSSLGRWYKDEQELEFPFTSMLHRP